MRERERERERERTNLLVESDSSPQRKVMDEGNDVGNGVGISKRGWLRRTEERKRRRNL